MFTCFTAMSLETLVLTDPTYLLAAGAAGLSLLWWLSTRCPQGLPPGPGPALPLVGHLHLMDKDPRAKFQAWQRKYGDVFSLYLGSQLVVVLNRYDVIKEAIVKMPEVFNHRPYLYTIHKITQGNGMCVVWFSLGAKCVAF